MYNVNISERQYKLMQEEKQVHMQKPEAIKIYDAIIAGASKDQIMQEINAPVSEEIIHIIDAVDKLSAVAKIPPLSKTSPIKIAVIIPHFNHTIYLAQVLESLKNQTSLPDEVIIVDDVSDDLEKVKEVCSNYCQFLNIKLIASRTKLYAGGARQLGAEHSQSDIVVMHDSDDISQKNRIELTRRFFYNNPTALHLNLGYLILHDDLLDYVDSFSHVELDKYIVGTDRILQSMKTIFVNQQFSVRRDYGCRSGCYSAEGTRFSTHSGHVAYRRELVDIAKWASKENYIFTRYEDYEFNLMLLLAGRRSYLLDLPLIYYRLGSTSNFTAHNIATR